MYQRNLFFALTMLLSILSTACVASRCSYAQEEQTEGDAKSQAESQESKTAQTSKASESNSAEQPEEKMLLDVRMKMIDGREVNLKKYHGKVVLIVNVASKCGFTGQYKPLQAIHEEYSKHGFEVVAFPCNQFGKQEPHDEPAINDFCKQKFGIEFDLFSKTNVKGKSQAELFKRLTAIELKPAGKGDIRWNFEKFLIGKDGKAIARYRSHVAPDNDAIILKIKQALGIEPTAEHESDPAKQSDAKSTPPQKGVQSGSDKNGEAADKKHDLKKGSEAKTKTEPAKKQNRS